MSRPPSRPSTHAIAGTGGSLGPVSGASFAAEPLPPDAIELGRVLDAWGVKGWLRIQPHSADASALSSASDWYLQPPEARFSRGFSAFSGCVRASVTEIRSHSDGLIAKLDGVDDRAAAEALKGVRLYMPRSAFPPPRDGEFYWVDLIGLPVLNRDGVLLGEVRDLMPTGPTTVLVLACTEEVDGTLRDAERMIPFVSAYVDEVDLKARRILVDWGIDY